jgi:hypothetical protein
VPALRQSSEAGAGGLKAQRGQQEAHQSCGGRRSRAAGHANGRPRRSPTTGDTGRACLSTASSRAARQQAAYFGALRPIKIAPQSSVWPILENYGCRWIETVIKILQEAGRLSTVARQPGSFDALRPIKIAPPVIGLADSRKLWL